jgi:hypothetical protein
MRHSPSKTKTILAHGRCCAHFGHDLLLRTTNRNVVCVGQPSRTKSSSQLGLGASLRWPRSKQVGHVLVGVRFTVVVVVLSVVVLFILTLLLLEPTLLFLRAQQLLLQ